MINSWNALPQHVVDSMHHRPMHSRTDWTNIGRIWAHESFGYQAHQPQVQVQVNDRSRPISIDDVCILNVVLLAVILSANSGTFYRGFLLQARKPDINTMSYGNFSVSATPLAQTLNCFVQSDTWVSRRMCIFGPDRGPQSLQTLPFDFFKFFLLFFLLLSDFRNSLRLCQYATDGI